MEWKVSQREYSPLTSIQMNGGKILDENILSLSLFPERCLRARFYGRVDESYYVQ